MRSWSILDLVGIFVFALSGGLVAVRKELDIFGVLVLAGTTGLGGGFLRDVLIGAAPPAALADWRYLMVPVAAGLVTFWFHPALGRMERLVNVFDAAGLALFCVTGALKALDYGLGPVPAALMGMLTGDRRRHAARPARRPGAGGAARRAVRHPGAGRRGGGGGRQRGRAAHGWSRCRRPGLLRVAGARDAPRLERAPAVSAAPSTWPGAHQTIVPGSPLNGPTTREVTQPP